ncbi:MAG TPA: hypothetical protein VFD58_15685 [Blastocatellia bacterium]|nr:hypothetical protein [Blastocatellia bacterium]
MDKSEVSVATITWARDGQEEKLLRESLRCLAEKDLPAAITDGGSGPQFIDYLSSFPGFKVSGLTQPGVVAQMKSSLKTAAVFGTRFILYTESDKNLFFQHKLADFLSQAPDDDRCGIILASRSAASFSTYPESQRYIETVVNQLAGRITGRQGDYSYGPMLINRALIPCMELAEAAIGWGWRPYLVGIAHRAGYRIVHWEADLPCPPEQREDSREELIHRMRQLSQNVAGLIHSTSVPETILPACPE